MQKWAKCYNFARFASFLPAYNLCPSWEQVRINFCSNWAEVGLGTSAQFGRRCISFYSQLGNNFAHVYALQIGKQCKPVQVHLFTKIPPEEKFSQIACWGKHPQSPLNATCGVSCAFILNTFTYWLLRNLHRSSIFYKRKNENMGEIVPDYLCDMRQSTSQ